MSAVSRQDKQAARTATELERRYGFSKTFAEVMGIATDARTLAEKAVELDKSLDQEEIFNRLTNYGEAQGVFRGEDGQIYINAEYIVALYKLFANDITMTGKFTNTVEAFVEPSDPELQTIENHTLGIATIPADRIPLYDFNNDGVVTAADALMGHKASMGIQSLENWTGAKKTHVTLTIDLKDPEKALQISGVNMWGRAFSEYVGVGGTSLRHSGTADYVVEQGTEIATNGTAWEYRKWHSGKVECWAKYATTVDMTESWGSGFYASPSFCVDLPLTLFKYTPLFNITSTGDHGAFLFIHSEGSSIATPFMRAVRPTSATNANLIIHIYAHGVWKNGVI